MFLATAKAEFCSVSPVVSDLLSGLGSWALLLMYSIFFRT